MCRDEIDPTKMKDGVAQYLRLPLARHFLFSTISFIIELSSHLQCHETRIHLFYMKYLYERHSNFHIYLSSCLLIPHVGALVAEIMLSINLTALTLLSQMLLKNPHLNFGPLNASSTLWSNNVARLCMSSLSFIISHHQDPSVFAELIARQQINLASFPSIYVTRRGEKVRRRMSEISSPARSGRAM